MNKVENPRKIYTKVVFDMSTGRTIEEESFDYSGPLALCEGEGDGDGLPEWTKTLPEDVRAWDEVKNSDAPEKFWDQMVNMRSRMGSSIRIPSADAGDEDRAAFHKKLQEKVPGLIAAPDFEKEETLNDLYTRMGRPADPKEYKLPEFTDSKGNKLEGAGKDLAESLRAAAHKAGLSQGKFEEVLSSIITPSIQAREQAIALHEADKAKLAETWGAAHGRNSNIVNNFLSKTDAPKVLVDTLSKGSVDSETMVWLHNLATKSVGTQGAFQDDHSASGVMSPDEAALKISEIRNNPKHPYYNRLDPGNAAAKKYMRELYLLKNPKNGTSAAPGTKFEIGGGLE